MMRNSVAGVLFATMLWLGSVVMQAQTPAEPLPLVDISLPDTSALIERHVWTDGVKIAMRSGGTEQFSVSDASIKGRGHSTWSKRKKPYVVRLSGPRSVLGMPAHREWALLANVMDHSHLRNHLAFEVARQTSLDWTPRGVFAKLRIDGKDEGLYYLTELIRIDDSRLRPKDCAVLVELDAHKDGLAELTMPDGSHPKDWRAATGAQSLRLDTLSLVDWLIVNELLMNAEVHGPRSCYMHITPDGILRAGPVWDYDLAFNEVGVDAGGDIRPARFKGKMDGVRWLDVDSLFCLDAGFTEALAARGFPVPSKGELLALMKHRWKSLRNKFYVLESELDRQGEIIRRDAELDQQQWNSADPARFDPSDSFAASLIRLKQTFRRRLTFMDKLLAE